MKKTKYTVDYFINKFKAIPISKWCENEFDNGRGQRCAGGHCGMTAMRVVDGFSYTPEYIALIKLIHRVVEINDGVIPTYKQKTPKGRILHALTQAKMRGSK